MSRSRLMWRSSGLSMLLFCTSVPSLGCGGPQAGGDGEHGARAAAGGPEGVRGGAAGPGAATSESHPIAAAAIVSPASGVAYVSEPERGIAAVRLADGHVIWRSSAADRPLVAGGGSLVAQEAPGDPRHHVRLAVMNAADGTVRARSSPIPLPEWIVPWPWYNGDVTSFDAEAALFGEVAIYRWDAHTSPVCGGMEGSPCTGTGARSSGAARVALEGGRATMLGEDAAGPIGERPEPPAFARLVGTLYSGSIPGSHTVADGALVATRMAERAGRKVLVLVRFDPVTGDERSSVDLTPADGDESAMSSAVPRFSEDDRHLALTRLFMVPSPHYTRAIHALDDARVLGEHELGNPREPYIGPFVVSGDALVHASQDGATLHASAIADGATRFTHALRVTHRHSQPAKAE